ncbi:retinitis pigmentosa 9 protein homolog isoform X1 [Lethenteron reissneri]|uniref:retinitis pigmentosa 9 protein homolog isoform X1 n=1 Tax=Lethenteron reissneri TaxID=7753 RepID=UPI002AB6FF54|nr:retinitis pigmentosa 9 protein homolog isoform X1 [Lethenteron reissneri]XP_061432233.1 retinitis pigmentosa 9 protein homolog isoform X1 [Lethenteron reissneri]XP_061432234.1 retinitis pigmentosa 9 protein homolog isoform X1 [Lethenteron reissneri]XP_061432236.1 retinitis pigmentosa 9 protein homolog isoform X1 [Lethenteron reissneri]XP_061432237.1 retinitis pigmentosa 9 protein homolog isoform X1 [Lethenteron reissneri]XP_061432238.1 retinitis pigmentosa 9 protein homolog isoform X1 [Leth
MPRTSKDRQKRRRGSDSSADAALMERLQRRGHDDVQQLKHVETFYEKPPPSLIKENDDKPEDCIPDLPGNENARDFLASAPSKGLWMPLGKEVKVMQCWRCKQYGHRTGDRECPYFSSGNQRLEQFRVAHEDPMYDITRENKQQEKQLRLEQLKRLLEESTTGSSSSSDSSREDRKKRRKKEKKKKKKKMKEKKDKRKHKRRKSKQSSSDSSD